MDEYYTYSVDAMGAIAGETDMIAKLQDGPISCAIAVPDDLETFDGKSIYEDKTGDVTLVHGITVVGYGVDGTTPYWLVRNSWGSSWADKGFFKVIRGSNNIGIESDC